MRRILPRAAPLLVVLLLAAPVVLATPEEASASPACPAGFRTMEGVGKVCPRESGLYEVFARDMTSLGFIHGPDPVPPADGPGALAGGTTPHCVSGAPGTYHIQVIYARAFDDVDLYATSVGMLRHLTAQSNKLVDDAGLATGAGASLNVKCVNGEIEVKNEVLPTAMVYATFSSITEDLRARGYNDGKVKYWVYYDDTSACTCGGMGHIYGDDRLSASNWNNGNGGPMFAVTFGHNSTRIWLHELGHNMGAVQINAPHTSGGWHCNDGRDIMCYADGGSNSSYTNGRCSVELWDCGKDSYFHTNPPPGSYLAGKWNTGSVLNRFITLSGHGVPFLAELVCSTPVQVGDDTVCSFLAYDDSSGVRYTVDWGDGAVQHVPSGTGYVAPGSTQTASHAYADVGTYTVTVSVVDASGVAGNTKVATVKVAAEFVPPTLTITEPRARTIYRGCESSTTAPALLTRPLWLERLCVKADATDASGVAYVELYVAGIRRGMDLEAPYEFDLPVPQLQVNTPVHVVAYDHAGNRASAAVSVDMVPPLPS